MARTRNAEAATCTWQTKHPVTGKRRRACGTAIAPGEGAYWGKKHARRLHLLWPGCCAMERDNAPFPNRTNEGEL